MMAPGILFCEQQATENLLSGFCLPCRYPDQQYVPIHDFQEDNDNLNIPLI